LINPITCKVIGFSHDGSLFLFKGKIPSIEITLDAKDVSCLYMIKNTLGYGSITKRTKANAFRFRTTKQADAKNLVQRINGFLLTESKHSQLIKLCKFYNIKPIIPDYDKSVYIVKNTAWLSGFFDAEGHFNIMNKFTIAFHISQKDKLILEIILNERTSFAWTFSHLNLGNIRYDSSWKGWTYTICNQKGNDNKLRLLSFFPIAFILNLFSKYTLQTKKKKMFYL